MFINIDMPYFELGWGTLHLEDTIRVTNDGFELFTSNKSDLRVL
jgi:Xaa-Pro aminopeptidase